MASYDYEIVNLALTRLGATRIASLSETSRNATEANAIYTLIRDEVLRSHPWSFATRLEVLQSHVSNVLTVTAITKANPGVLTYTGTDPEDGDRYIIEDVGGMTELNDNYFMVHSVNAGANTFSIYDEAGEPVNTSSYSAYTAGGTATHIIPANEKFSYTYDLRANALKVLKLNNDREIQFEVAQNRYLYCDEEEVIAECIYKVTDVTKYDAHFVDAFAWRLAAELAVVITGSLEKHKMAMEMAAYSMEKAKGHDASERREAYPSFSRYQTARR